MMRAIKLTNEQGKKLLDYLNNHRVNMGYTEHRLCSEMKVTQGIFSILREKDSTFEKYPSRRTLVHIASYFNTRPERIVGRLDAPSMESIEGSMDSASHVLEQSTVNVGEHTSILPPMVVTTALASVVVNIDDSLKRMVGVLENIHATLQTMSERVDRIGDIADMWK